MKLIWSYVVLGCAAVACGDSSDNNITHLPTGSSTDVVTSATPEPAGSNCQYGGTKVEVGVDANGNGVLDPDEVQSTFYVCDQAPAPDPLANVYYGDLIISSTADVAAAQNYTGVIGNLIITANSDVGTLDVELPNLTFVTGEVGNCNDNQIQGLVARPAKRPVPASPTATVSLAALQVTGGIDFECGNAVTTLAFPALTAIHGDFGLIGSVVMSWSAPLLASIQGTIFVNSTSLTTLTLPAPGDAINDSLDIADNPLLDECALDDLAGAIRRSGFHGTIAIGNNGTGSGSGSDEVGGCTDVAHACQAVTIGSDSADWRECYQATEFADARTQCQAIGAGWDLAYLTSLDDEHSIGAFSSNGTYWIGYYQVGSDAPYTWVQTPDPTFAPQSSGDGSSDATFWNAGEPNGDANPDCVQIFLNDQLDPSSVVANDIPCGNNYQPLCRYLAPQP